jgi:hypothetical protein
MILVRTHSNRWIARERVDRPAVGRVTRIDGEQAPSNYRTELFIPAAAERILLRDADCLDVAFALLLAAITRSQAMGENV